MNLGLIDAGIEIKDFMVSSNAAFLKGKPILDLNYQEQLKSRGYLTISYLPASNQISFMELSKSKITPKDFQTLLDLAC